MRAYMSDLYGRMSHLCAFVPPQSFPCAENDRAIGAATADKALAEARAILAETEPMLPSVTWFEPGIRLTAATTAHRTFDQMRAGNTAPALAEALAAFVEGN